MAPSTEALALGVDVDTAFGLPRRWNLCTGSKNVGNAIARRLSTPRGSLPSDLDYGYDVRALLNSGLTRAGMSQAKGAITAQVEKEERVLSVADIAFVFDTTTPAPTLKIGMNVDTDTGPFALVLAVSQVSIDVLQGTAGTTFLAAALASNPAAQLVPGPAGGPGPAGAQGIQGPAGGGGGGGGGLALDDPTEGGTSSGGEEVIRQFTADVGAIAGGTIAIDATLRAKTVSGTATVRVYVGGTYDAADGTLVGQQTLTSAGFTPIQIAASVANPTGVVPVKITLQSPSAGVEARLRDTTVTIA